MASVFRDGQGTLLAEFLERVATINWERYAKTLKKLKQRIRRLWPNRKMNQDLLLHDKATAHQSAHSAGNSNNGARLFSLNLPAAPICHPPTSIFLTSLRMHAEDVVLRTLRRGERQRAWRATTLQQRFLRDRYIVSHAGVEKCVGNETDFVKKVINYVKDVLTIHVNFIITVITVHETKQGVLLSYRPSYMVHKFRASSRPGYEFCTMTPSTSRYLSL
jgi:hypothetical protein